MKSSFDEKVAKNVTVLLGEPENELRSLIRTSMQRNGLTGMQEFSSLKRLAATASLGIIDMMILDARMNNENVAEFIRLVRHGKIGENPYVPIIVMIWNPSKEDVHALIDSGADDILIKPVSPTNIVDRIKVVVDARKPFIVTSDYIGPDRRKSDDRDNSIPLLDVPNTMRDKMQGKTITLDDLKEKVAGVNIEVNEQRMGRNAFQISFQVDIVLKALEDGPVTDEVKQSLSRVANAAKDTATRLKNTEYAYVDELTRSIVKVAGKIATSEGMADPKQMAMLKHLSDAILRAFNPNEDAESLAKQISSAVNNFETRTKTQTGSKKSA